MPTDTLRQQLFHLLEQDKIDFDEVQLALNDFRDLQKKKEEEANAQAAMEKQFLAERDSETEALLDHIIGYLWRFFGKEMDEAGIELSDLEKMTTDEFISSIEEVIALWPQVKATLDAYTKYFKGPIFDLTNWFKI